MGRTGDKASDANVGLFVRHSDQGLAEVAADDRQGEGAVGGRVSLREDRAVRNGEYTGCSFPASRSSRQRVERMQHVEHAREEHLRVSATQARGHSDKVLEEWNHISPPVAVRNISMRNVSGT